MHTHAEPTPDGEHFILNGEKLWCTNGTKAGVIVVMAKTPPKIVNGKSKDQITAFIVEMDRPGVEVTHRCHFMGLQALYNGVMRFTNVRVPRENILLAEGKGLRVALTTLNTGRLTLPAACVGLAKRCLEISRQWAAERVQWGAPIGKHAAIADKIARMAANTFAMESMTLLAASLGGPRQTRRRPPRSRHVQDVGHANRRGKSSNDADANPRRTRLRNRRLAARRAARQPVPLERFLRDCRINTIFEGSSEIMRLFIAREALDPHLKVSGAVLNSQIADAGATAGRARGRAVLCRLVSEAMAAAAVVPGARCQVSGGTTTSSLCRAHQPAAGASALPRHGPPAGRSSNASNCCSGRFVDIGTELFAISATCLRAEYLLRSDAKETVNKAELLQLVDYFCRASRLRIAEKFRALRRNADHAGYKLAQHVLKTSQPASRNGNSSHA